MKKAIDWLALVVGVALALFGARWMWTGWDIVQAERGWAAVIAGSVMLSGGLIVAMLAWTIMRLSGAPAERQAPPAQAGKPGLFGKPSIAAPAAVAAGAGAIAATAGAALARDVAPDEDAHKAPKDAAQEPVPSPPPLPPTAPPTVGELLRMSEDRAARDSHEKHFEEPEAAIAPPVEEAKAEPPAALEPGADEDDDDEDEEEAPEAEAETQEPVTPAAAEKPAPVLPPVPPLADPSPKEIEPPPAPLRLPEPEPATPRAATDEEPVYDDWLERTARELGRDALPKDELPPAEEPAAPSKPEPAVVGRYSSGDTNYLMFADGSIEAQTPEGVMRFASLTELKRFVEKRN